MNKLKLYTKALENKSESEVQNILMEYLRKFVPSRVINNGTGKKYISILGNIESDDQNVEFLYRLEKRSFDVDEISKKIRDIRNVKLNRQLDENKFEFICDLGDCGDAVLFVEEHPSESTIKIHSEKDLIMWLETPQYYECYTRRYIQSNISNAEWMRKAVSGESLERILWNDPHPNFGFCIIKDVKWQDDDMKNFYLLVLVKSFDVRTVRDLTGEHIPLLKYLLDKINEFMKHQMKISLEKYTIYLHYLPTYFHLHLHVVPIGNVVFTLREHLLNDVIDNLENIAPDFYQRKSISMLLPRHIFEEIVRN